MSGTTLEFELHRFTDAVDVFLARRIVVCSLARKVAAAGIQGRVGQVVRERGRVGHDQVGVDSRRTQEGGSQNTHFEDHIDEICCWFFEVSI